MRIGVQLRRIAVAWLAAICLSALAWLAAGRPRAAATQVFAESAAVVSVQIDDDEAQTYTDIGAAITAAQTAATDTNTVTIKLLADAGKDQGIMFNTAGTYVLDMNGHVLRNTKTGSGSAVTVSGSSGTPISLAIMSSAPQAEIPYNNPFESGETLTAYGGLLTGAKSGGVKTSGSNTTVTLENVTVAGNEDNSNGGGLNLGGGNVTLKSGARVCYNQSYRGGGIYCYNANFRVEDGASVSYNRATSGNGGGIYFSANSNSSCTIAGEISYNEAASGGGLYMQDGTNTIKETAEIRGNTALSNGGGILFYNTSGTNTIEAASITQNTANNGGGIYVNGSLSLAGTKACGNKAQKGNDIYADPISVSGAVQIGDLSITPITSDKHVKVTGDLTGASIGISFWYSDTGKITVTENFGTYNSGVHPKTIFHAFNDSAHIDDESTNELKMTQHRGVDDATCTNKKTCSVCGEEVGAHTCGEFTEEIAPTCTTAGAHAHSECTVCHKLFDRMYAEISENDAIVPATGHAYGNWQTVTAATEQAAGLERRVCATCGDTDERAIPKLTPTVPDDNTGDNSGGNTGDNSGGNTGDNSGDNTGGNTGGNTGDNTGGNTGKSDDNKDLSTGAIVGICIACVAAAIAVAGVLLYFFVFRKKGQDIDEK